MTALQKRCDAARAILTERPMNTRSPATTARTIRHAVGRDPATAGHAWVDFTADLAGRDVAGTRDAQSRVAHDGAVVEDLPTARHGTAEFGARTAVDRDRPAAGDLCLHAAGDCTDGDLPAAGYFEIGILGHRGDRGLAGTRDVPDQGLDAVRHQFRPHGRTEVELGVEAVGDTDRTDQFADLHVDGTGDDQGEPDGSIQVDFTAVDDDRVAVPGGEAAVRPAARDRDVAADDDAATEVVARATRLEGDFPLQLERAAVVHTAADGAEHLLVAAVADQGDGRGGHRDDAHLSEHPSQDDLADVAGEVLVHPPLTLGQVAAVGQGCAGTEELAKPCTHWVRS